MNSIAVRSAISGLVLLLIAAWAWSLSSEPSARNLVFSLLTGTVFGIVLQRARFCFLCNFRDFLDDRDPWGLIAIAVALGVGAILYFSVMMAWVPVPQPDRLPPNAHVGPVGWVLGVGAFVFGLGMAISGSCLSAHFYRLGEGSPTSPFALLGAALGFLLGFLTWNPLYLASISESRPIWLPFQLGYAGALAATLAILAVVVVVLFAAGRWSPRPALAPGVPALGRAVFVDRWPAVVGGLFIAAISAIYYLRVAPLGVTAELGSLVRTAGTSLEILPGTLLGLDTLRGCATAVKETLLSPNGLLVVGLVLGSFAAAFGAGQFRPTLPTGAQIAKGLAGGVLMGWGAMVSLGCTVGVLLSGIHAGAMSGWVFLFFCTFGVWLGLVAMRRFGWR
ncbi:MAG: YeeE/YedE family protein [Rhizobiaceae bacterium]|nr:YeeE/YedE family protein [Rhizobiaceae bacterium]